MLKIEKKITVVIHVVDEDQVLKNIETCVNCGVYGVFLIHMKGQDKTLVDVYKKVRSLYPRLWIGLNFLSQKTIKNIVTNNFLLPDMNALWLDNSGVYEDERGYSQAAESRITLDEFNLRNGCKIKLFGGTAFKYQEEVKDLEWVTQTAAKWVDVVTTSGDRTGSAACIDKIEDMHYYLPHYSELALASGVTPENVKDYHGVTWFLVATSVTTEDEFIMDDRLKTLMQNVIK